MGADPWQVWREWAQRAAASWSPSGSAAPGLSPPPLQDAFAAPWATAFERFAADARSYLGQMGLAGESSAAVAEAARRFGDHLREQFEHLMPLGHAFGVPPASSAMPGGAAAPMPALGATREHQERTERLFESWHRMQEAQQRLQRLWSDALREAALAFGTKLAQEPHPAPTPEGLRALYDVWIECAEQAYARVAHGPDFCRALADLVNASSEWRREMQATFELGAKAFDLPTRSEINTLNARLTAVEEALRAAPREAAPKPARAARRKTKR